MNGMKRWAVLLLAATAMATLGGCKTTTVVKEVPQPVRHDDHPDHPDHPDDHHPPPPPPDRR